MKSYEDISERVFKKGDEILKKKQKRTAIIKRTSLTVSGVCAIIFISFGLWKNNDIKNALNNNWMNDKQIITENKDFPETTTEYKNNGTAPSVMSTASGTAGNSAVFSSVTTSAVTSEKNKSSENAVTCTKALNKIYSVSTSQVKTEEITDKKTIDTTEVNTAEIQIEITHEKTQTTVSTAVEINSTETNTTFLTETTTTSENTDDEGGIYMKKLTSFFTSAVVLAASATPIIGNAEYNIDTSRYWEGEKAMFSRMDSGEFEVDIDGNGVVDAIDGYLLECYLYNEDVDGYYIICDYCDSIIKCCRYDEEDDDYYIGNTCAQCGYISRWHTYRVGLGLSLSDEIKERIEAVADYNEDGIIDSDDATSWVRYFVVNRNLKVELFNPDYYVSEYVLNDDKYTLCAKNAFIDNLYLQMYYLQAQYDIMVEMYESGIINLDINENGQLDIDDIYKLYVDYHFYDIVYDSYRLDFGRYDITDRSTFISDEEAERCEEAFVTYRSTISWAVNWDDFVHYAILYIIGHIELKPEYLTEEYYKDRYGNNYLESAHYIVSAQVKNAAERLGLKPDENEWIKYNADDLNEFFEFYCNDVENGLRPAPDVNMDGVVDYKDYFASNIYLEDLINSRTADDSILPEDIWNNLAENCDFNGNGTSKDIYDILTIQLYVVKYTEKDDNFSFTNAYNEYVNSLGGTSAESIEGFSYENNIMILSNLEKSHILYGDANCDDKVTIADATAIIQALGNQDEYALSAQGAINADVVNNGDGVTGDDANAIQAIEAGFVKQTDFPMTKAKLSAAMAG